jgi:flagellar biosynthesis chaperone FliJ
VTRGFSHGQEIRAEEIALHQKFLDALSRLRAAEADDDQSEVRHLRPVVDRARARWLKANKRLVRGG